MAWSRSVVVLAVLLATGCTASPPAPTGSATASPEPAASTAPASSDPVETSGGPRAASIDTSDWITFASERYRFSIGHPPDWTVEPSEHDWTTASDAQRVDSTGQEAFMSPQGDIRVSAWAAPAPSEESRDALQAWVEQYCEESANRPCDAVDEAQPLCVERWDCHPAMLVVFAQDVQAFMTGGVMGRQTVVVALWREEADGAIPGYGTPAELLRAFLATMDVCPMGHGDPRGCGRDIPRAGVATGDPMVTERE
ncbi:hypothetical protein ABIB37_001752 [Agrococcus sp. UYP10]|uniref:hypothetical protein n=1 Tax=Agrococcus sp. UYP10 TaxID=1756355 RepID=UPI0033939A0D